jgi:hypothetical protein
MLNHKPSPGDTHTNLSAFLEYLPSLYLPELNNKADAKYKTISIFKITSHGLSHQNQIFTVNLINITRGWINLPLNA